MMRRTPLVLAGLLPLAAGCTSSDTPAPATTSAAAAPLTITTTPSTAPAAPAATVPAGTGNLTLTVTDLRLVNSEESDNGFRVIFDSLASEATVVLTGLPTPNRVVLACAAAGLDRRGTQCVTPADGEPVRLSLAPTYRGVEIVQVGVSGSGPAGNATTIGTISVTYPAISGRQLRLRLPTMVQGESGGQPSFRLSPAGTGAYRVTSAWSTAGGGSGEAELTFTAGGSTTRAQGGPGTELTGNVAPAAEATLRFRNTGSLTLLAPTITATFP